jgi:hypothetical protein
MTERSREFLVYIQVLLLLCIIGAGAAVLIGQRVGGPLGSLYLSLRDMLARDDRVTADELSPADLPGTGSTTLPVRLPSSADTKIAPMLVLPEPPDPTPGVPCASFHFEASLGIDRGYLSFGRFNVVTGTDPYGRSDPLTIWKLLQFNGFRVNAEGVEAGRAASIPVNETVNLLVSDPFSEELLFSAKWRVDTVEARGRYGSINAGLATNLSAFGVNNAIDSPTLDSFAEASEGVLVMRFESDRDIAPALRAGEPVYGPVTGTMYPEHCIRD